MAQPIPKRNAQSSSLPQALALAAALNSGASRATEDSSATANTLAALQAAQRNTTAGTRRSNRAENWQRMADNQSQMMEESYGQNRTLNQRSLDSTASPSNNSPTPPPTPGSPEALARQQAKNRAIQKAEQKIADKKLDLKGALIDNGLLEMAGRIIPGFGMMLKTLETAKPEKQVKILKRTKGVLTVAETGAGLLDGLLLWVKIFGATLETIIIPLILIVLFLPWMVIYALFGKTLNGKFSKAIDQVRTIIDKLLAQVENKLKKKTMKQATLARLEQFRRQPSA